jgi:branched-chain amino acid transport system substrate-binding protein
VTKRPLAASAAFALALALAACADDGGGSGADSDEPIVVGSTLSLTGAFAATGAIHQLAGEMYVERLNEDGGLMGRQVEWTVLDDESDQAQVTQLYERLVSQEQVDLLMGPYATPNILSAVAVAERHGYVLPQHTAVIAPLLTYECQFPAWSIGTEPNVYVPEQLFDAVESLPEPPQTVAIVTNETGSTDFIGYGSPDDDSDPGFVSIAEDRGYDVVAEIRYPPTTTDWAPIAAEIRNADPDLVVNNGLGVDPVNLVQAMDQLNYQPPLMFSLFPAPGPLLGLGPVAERMLSVSIFEGSESTAEDYGDEAAEIVDDFEQRATEAELPYTAFETQAAASWNAWEILTQGVENAESLEQQDVCDALHEEGAETTFSGALEFDPEQNNFWESTQGIKQIQDGTWVMVWPSDQATTELRPPAG